MRFSSHVTAPASYHA
ncbi:unnamed protein product [Oikopleura dioica]|uniref:Uncharacterized protein n=1 Tax=Oikopleura dioica TaxID=34765 RepID=E4WRS8_OIKDI|nr:unnamed protein product [Oikopleura dioica]